jgi:hypothetical protein
MTSIEPQLWVEGASAAVAFYQAAFGATVLHSVGEGDDIVAQLGGGAIQILGDRSEREYETLQPTCHGRHDGQDASGRRRPWIGCEECCRCRRCRDFFSHSRARVAPGTNRRSVRARVGNR